VDNAYLGIHEMTVLGKALAQAFYWQDPALFLFSRQFDGRAPGLVEAQRYPDDYDGSSPVARRSTGTARSAFLWPHVVMASAGKSRVEGQVRRGHGRCRGGL